MINNDNLAKLYEAVLANEELTTKKLNGFGLNSKDLNDLIQRGSIERVKRGLYSLKNINELFYYGKYLVGNKEYDKATYCFEKCHELDKTHLGACFQLFIRSIQKKDYERAFELYDKLLESDNEYYLIDAKLYLYLLSKITKVPERYIELTKSLKLKDLLIPSTDKRYEDIPKQNTIRSDIFNGKISYALKQLNDLNFKRGFLTTQDVILKKLLVQAVEKENKTKTNIFNLINEDKYQEVVDILEEKQEMHELNKVDSCILELAKKIIEMQKTSLVPLCNYEETSNIFDAVKNCNYSLALRLCNKYKEDYNISNDKNSISLLLEKINGLIKTLSGVDRLDDEDIFNVNLDFIKDEVTFPMIISYLLNNEIDKAFDSLEIYMESIGKSEYLFLIANLIKISLLEKDYDFSKPLYALDMINNNEVLFDVTNYIKEFYIALSLNKFDEARIYLDIISNGSKFGNEVIPVDKLYRVLELSMNVANKKSDDSLPFDNKKMVEDSKKDCSSKNVLDKKSTNSGLSLSNDVNVNKSYQDDSRNGRDTQYKKDEDLVIKKHDELLKSKGIILIKSLKDDKIDSVLSIARQYPDMIASVIGQGKNRQILLKYKAPKSNERVDVKGLFRVGNEAFRNQKYKECIDNYLQLLQFFDEPRSSIYSKIGICYLKLKKKPFAIDYLTVATALSDKDDYKFDYSDLIFNLANPYYSAEIKPVIKMNNNDFNYENENTLYGIDNFDEINSYIINSGLDVESACQQLNISQEQANIIKLMYAKEYYAQGYFEKGDSFLKSFEKSEYKTKEAMVLFREIMKNKKFYQNRKTDQPRQLSLNLKPKK